MSEILELAAGRFLRLVRRGTWEYAERRRASGVVAVLATTADDELVLTEQYRPPVASRVIDLPAGLAGDIAGQEQEALATAAQRELEEETGFTAENFEHVGRLPSSPGLTSEIVDLFTARRLTRTGAGSGVDGEQIVVHLVSRTEIAGWLKARVKDGCLVDTKVYAGLWWHGQSRNE